MKVSAFIFKIANYKDLGFLQGGTSGKEPSCQGRRSREHGLDPWARKTPWRRAWQPTSVLLPREPHGQRSLAGYRPQNRKVRHD